MASRATTRSDVLEREYEKAVAIVVRGAGVLVAALIGAYLSGTFGQAQVQMFCFILAIAGAIVCLAAGLRVYRARSGPVAVFECPYCTFEMKFPQQPTEDFDCEHCHRRVYFDETGRLATILDVTCASCRKKHRVSVKAALLICDGCNRAVNLPGRTPGQAAEPAPEVHEAYMVVLTEVGRRPNDVAQAVQDLLVCNLAEARKRLQGLPLTLVEDVPMRKADAIARRLEERGAGVAIRPMPGARRDGHR